MSDRPHIWVDGDSAVTEFDGLWFYYHRDTESAYNEWCLTVKVGRDGVVIERIPEEWIGVNYSDHPELGLIAGLAIYQSVVGNADHNP